MEYSYEWASLYNPLLISVKWRLVKKISTEFPVWNWKPSNWWRKFNGKLFMELKKKSSFSYFISNVRIRRNVEVIMSIYNIRFRLRIEKSFYQSLIFVFVMNELFEISCAKSEKTVSVKPLKPLKCTMRILTTNISIEALKMFRQNRFFCWTLNIFSLTFHFFQPNFFCNINTMWVFPWHSIHFQSFFVVEHLVTSFWLIISLNWKWKLTCSWIVKLMSLHYNVMWLITNVKKLNIENTENSLEIVAM